MDKNKQYGNIGNLGDIYKHAALVNLSSELQPAIYLDTHSFLCYGPCHDSAEWYSSMGELLKNDDKYLKYFQIEEPNVSRGKYLCSSSLVRKVTHDPDVFLSESDPATRTILITQLSMALRTNNTVVMPNADAWSDYKFTPPGRALVLFDPFSINDIGIKTVSKIMGNIFKDRDGALEIFTYKKGTVEFPSLSESGLELVFVLHEIPYHLAIYATKIDIKGFRDLIKNVLPREWRDVR